MLLPTISVAEDTARPGRYRANFINPFNVYLLHLTCLGHLQMKRDLTVSNSKSIKNGENINDFRPDAPLNL